MNNLFLESTDDTPHIDFNKDNGVLEISGRSLPEDIIVFYRQVYDWLDEYVSDPNEKTLFKVRIDYFNSASQRILNEILITLSQLALKDKEVLVLWQFMEEDEEILEMGKELEEISKLPFRYESYNPE